jgi:hypothetical protein
MSGFFSMFRLSAASVKPVTAGAKFTCRNFSAKMRVRRSLGWKAIPPSLDFSE